MEPLLQCVHCISLHVSYITSYHVKPHHVTLHHLTSIIGTHCIQWILQGDGCPANQHRKVVLWIVFFVCSWCWFVPYLSHTGLCQTLQLLPPHRLAGGKPWTMEDLAHLRATFATKTDQEMEVSCMMSHFVSFTICGVLYFITFSFVKVKFCCHNFVC